MKKLLLNTFFLLIIASCSNSRKINNSNASISTHTSVKPEISKRTINTKNVNADSLVLFAEMLVGVKYKYGSAIKENGFDCSGFINYVFNNFKISVPRSSVDFTNAGTEVSLDHCKRGDLILFTGTDTTGLGSRPYGHHHKK